MKRKIVITGSNGQLSQYLIKYLQDNEDIDIVGTIRHKSKEHTEYIFDTKKITFELMDLGDSHSIENLIIKYKPEYFVNTAANAYVGESWSVPEQQIEYNTLGVLRQLEAIRKHSNHTRYINIGTSEEFACIENEGAQNENTKIAPRSPYGCAKSAARYLVDVYRQSYNLYAIQPWCFNFESKLRGEKYVTRKITKNVARIYHAIKNNQGFEPLEIGNIYSNRSWQHASDVARGIWMQLNQESFNFKLGRNINYGFVGDLSRKDAWQWFSKNIKEYVLSASDTHTVKEFIEAAFKEAGFLGYWEGNGLDEKYFITDLTIDKKTNYRWSSNKDKIAAVVINSKFYRPLDVTFLHGDATKIKNDLGWETTISFYDIIKEMVEYDIKCYENV